MNKCRFKRQRKKEGFFLLILLTKEVLNVKNSRFFSRKEDNSGLVL